MPAASRASPTEDARRRTHLPNALQRIELPGVGEARDAAGIGSLHDGKSVHLCGVIAPGGQKRELACDYTKMMPAARATTAIDEALR